jgi:hypothetical protein
VNFTPDTTFVKDPLAVAIAIVIGVSVRRILQINRSVALVMLAPDGRAEPDRAMLTASVENPGDTAFADVYV